MEARKLRRKKQCSFCPWKVSTNPRRDIPNYSEEWHRSLKKTIADPENPYSTLESSKLNIFACHASLEKDPYCCVGWLDHQYHEGNNIRLRIELLPHLKNGYTFKIEGEQHKSFEDTLPK